MRSLLQPAKLAQHQPFAAHKAAVRARRRVTTKASEKQAHKATPAHKIAAAKYLVDKYVKDNTIVGINSGETVAAAVEYMSQKLDLGLLKDVQCLAASDTAATEAAFCGVRLASLDQVSEVDVMLCEADLVDPERNAVVLGCRSQPAQPALVRERLVARMSKQVVVIVDSPSYVVSRLQGSLPLVMADKTWEETADAVDDIFLGDAELWRRPSEGCSDPRGGTSPYISSEGHAIVDVRFYEGFCLYGEQADYAAIEDAVMSVPGVMATGLMVGAADVLCVLSPEGGEAQLVQLVRAEQS